MNDTFDLNKNRLDDEWCGQPRLYHDAAHKLADARQDLELAKAALEVADAELSLSIRSNPEDYGLEKVTEGSINSVITTNIKHEAAVSIEIKARHLVECLQADVITLDHRKKALEKLVDLRLSDYWSEPRLPARVEKAENVSDKIFKKKA